MSIENMWTGRQAVSRTDTMPGVRVGHNEGRAADALWVPDVPQWMGDALCAQTDPEAFFPEKGARVNVAKLVCQKCPVRQECLDYAILNGERHGIWGGLTERQRRPLRRVGAA